MFLKLIMPFVDPLTREKLHFNEELSRFVPREQLWADVGGDVQFEYDHDTYWPALNDLCKERASARKSRWEAAGKHYGESELYLKGGDAPSVGQKVEPEAAVVAAPGAEAVADKTTVAPEAKVVADKTPVVPEAAPVTEPATDIENKKPAVEETTA
jgi:hypothetical protein